MKLKFAEQLRAERARLKLTQPELARLLDVSARAVWAWENGDIPLNVTQEGVLSRLTISPTMARAWKAQKK